MRDFLIFIVLAISLQTFGQDENWRTIPSVKEWQKEINIWLNSIYQAERTEVRVDCDKDAQLISYEENDNAPLQGAEPRDERLKIDKRRRA